MELLRDAASAALAVTLGLILILVSLIPAAGVGFLIWTIGFPVAGSIVSAVLTLPSFAAGFTVALEIALRVGYHSNHGYLFNWKRID